MAQNQTNVAFFFNFSKQRFQQQKAFDTDESEQQNLLKIHQVNDLIITNEVFQTPGVS